MVYLRGLAAIVVASLMSGTGALADGLAGPSELPPSTFDGAQFVDSAGCAFMRAGVSGTTVWVARVDQNRQPLCGMDPTFGEMTAAVTPEPAMPETPSVPASEAPINTVATLTTPPAVAAPAATAPAAPRPAAPVVASAAANPRAPLTLAQACAGRTGVQPGLISSRTGQPIDCGGSAAPVVRVAETEPRRMTVAQICAETAATGRTFVDQATGQPVLCPSAVVSAPAGASSEPLRLTLADTCALSVQTGVRYRNAATGDLIVCPDMTVSPGFNTQVVAPSAIARSYWSFTNPFGTQMPISNPTGIVQPYAGPPPGYEPVWTDGQINVDRGFPPLSAVQMQARLAAQQPVMVERVSTQGVPFGEVMPGAGDLFVQLGAFGNPANAQRAVETLQALGLPVDLDRITRNGAQLQVVAAGPFASQAELQAALRAARGAGYADAYTRG